MAAVVRVLEDLDARQVLVEALAVPARGALLQAVLSASPMVLSLDGDKKSARRLPPRRLFVAIERENHGACRENRLQ